MLIKYLAFTLFILILSPLNTTLTPSYTTIGVGVYRGTGRPIYVNISIVEGNGEIYIEGVGYDDLFKYSAYSAVYEAFLTLGINPFEYDVFIKITPEGIDKTYLAGPSLSLTIYLSTLSELLGEKGEVKVVYSGTVNPDLTVGFVGYIEEKAHGLDSYDVDVFYIPLGERFKYVVEEKPIKIGPYIFKSTVVEKIPYNFSNLNIRVEEIGNCFQPYIDSLSYIDIGSISIDLENEHLSYMAGKLEGIVKRLLADVRNRIEIVMDELEKTNIRVMNPQSYRYILNLLSYTGANITVSEEFLKEKYLNLALEHALSAFRSVVEAYYLLIIITDEYTRLDRINSDTLLLISRATQVINTSLSRGVDEVSLVYKSYAARLYVEALRDIDLAISGLSFFEIEPYLLDDLPISISKELSKSIYKLLKAEAYALISSKYGDSSINVDEISDWIMKYIDTLFKYAYRYSQESKVSSEMVSQAGYSIDLARRVEVKLGNNSVSDLVKISYLVDALENISLYMALHPGFEEVYSLRYNSILKSLSVLLSNFTPDLMVYDLIITSNVFDEISLKISFLERAISILKVKSFLKGIISTHKDLFEWDSIETPSYEEDNNLERKDFDPLIIIPLAAAAGIVLVIILKRRGVI